MVEEGELRSRGIGRDEERVSPEKKEGKGKKERISLEVRERRGRKDERTEV